VAHILLGSILCTYTVPLQYCAAGVDGCANSESQSERELQKGERGQVANWDWGSHTDHPQGRGKKKDSVR
jgi:hypothetical protein